MHDQPDAVGTRALRCPRDILNGRRSPLSSRHQPQPSLLACYLMPRCCTSRRVRSMTPRHRSPCACARRRPACPVRCAPPRRSASTVTMSVPWLICRGRRIAYAAHGASASSFAAIASVTAASSPNGCPRWSPPGPGAPCGSPSALWPLASPWEARPVYASATSRTWW
jgi:hypothetical protein